MANPSSRSLVLSTLACALSLAASATACNKRLSTAPDSVSVRQLSATRWQVLVGGYETTALPLGVSYCAIGVKLPASSPVTSVSSVGVFASPSSASMPRFSFASSAGVASAFNNVSAGAWTGFLSQATGPYAGGDKNFLSFIFNVNSGTTRAQMETALKASTFGVDAATSAGNLLDRDRSTMTPTMVIDEPAFVLNAKTFYNSAKTDAATRVTQNADDTIYFMQPKDFRFGQGKGAGWRGVLQDGDRSTAEVCEFGYVAEGTGGAPDTSAAGLTTNVRVTLFGTGTGRAAILYTITPATQAPMPSVGGIRVMLPAPRSWPGDACTIHTQTGASTKVATANKAQWTYSLGSSGATSFGAVGTTFRIGGLHDCGIVRSYIRSTAYQATAEVLEGPESLFPSISRGDQIGFQVQHGGFGSNFSIIFLSPGYLPAALPTPFKSVLIQTLTLSGSPFAMSANGSFDTGSVPLPSTPVSFAFQAIFFRFNGPNVEAAFSDAMLVRTQS